jgi:thioredoxin-like negative regulator of GroEL
MKGVLHILLLLTASVAVMAAGTPAGWETDYMRVVAFSKTNRTPVLVYFTASWCGPCKLMARTTLVDPGVVAALKAVPHVILDIEEEPILSQKHAVRAVPTFQMILPSSATVESITGFQEAESFAPWITNALARANQRLQADEHHSEQLDAVFDALSGDDAPARVKAAMELLELIASASDPIRDRAMKRLSTLPSTDALLVLPGLNQPSLAVRIRAGNYLRARLGDSFDIDPWDSADTRSKAVEAWTRKLSFKSQAP